MDLVERLKNKIFKCYEHASIEYHANGFFVKKRAHYLLFRSNSTVIFYEREEGLHPSDSRCDLLLKDLDNEDAEFNTGKFSFENNNIVKITMDHTNNQLLLMPSIFIENVIQEDLSEIILDRRNGHVNIYTHVYSIPML